MTITNHATTASVNQVLNSLKDESSIDAAVSMLTSLRALDPSVTKTIDVHVLTRLVNMRKGVDAAKANHSKLEEIIQRVLEPPLSSAIYLGSQCVRGRRCARVLIGNSQRIVNFGPDIEPARLGKGDEVFLNKEMNLIIEKSHDGVPPFGETARFNRKTPDGRRMILDHRDQEIVVDIAAPLEQRDDIERGDIIRFDRTSSMAYEKIEREDRQGFFQKKIEEVTPDAVGGQKENVQKLIEALTCALIEPERAETYGLRGRRAIALVGPPGTGKTLIARVAAAEINRISDETCRFAVVRPGEFLSPWVGETERRIRECFQDLTDAAQSGISILFLDEVESSVGRIRGGPNGHHSDRFLAALLAEIDGFKDRSNVAILVATNRKDLIDSALYERLSEIEIEIGRPNMEAARAIFEIHLPNTIPVSANGASSSDTREEIIRTAVSRLYAPNSANEICTIKFRDGTTRTIRANELVSGRLISQICLAARQSAFSRELRCNEMEGQKLGLTSSDMHDAVSDALTKMKTTITRYNAHAYLADLPQDLDVVSVEPIRTKLAHTHEYITLS